MKSIHIVTGASRGIGRQIAIEMARQNKQVLAVARSTEKLQELELEFPDLIEIYTLDLLNSDALETFFEFIKSKKYNISTLINNAGLLIKGDFSTIRDEQWQQMFDIHVMAPVRLIRGVLSYFSEDAHIVNISSMAGFQGSTKFPGLAAYSTAKGALATATEAIAAELVQQGIHCNALCIGAVQTEMLEEAFPGFNAPVSDQQMGRYIAFFALNARSFYNGQVIPVNVQNPE